MNSYKDNMDAILNFMAAGDYEAAGKLVADVRNKAAAEEFQLKELEPEWGIAVASLCMDEGDFSGAEEVLNESLSVDINNYELYYMLGLCKEQTGAVEDAYYAYRMAAYLGNGTADQQLIQQQFVNLCSYANANAYKLGKACEAVVVERMKHGEYEKTHAFLGEQLYDTNKVAANIVLSEPNMLLHMMLEIVLCEKNRMSEGAFLTDNTIVRYDSDVNKFNEVYRQVKLAVRRVWFGASIEEQRKLNELLEEHSVSGDMLAVIAKYSVTEVYWEDVFARIAAIVQYKHPVIGMTMMQYKNWIAGLDIAGRKRCSEPTDFDNGAGVLRLDCKANILRFDSAGPSEKAMQQSDNDSVTEQDCETADSTIAIVFCTNDKLYEAECISYLKRLEVPKGMSLEIVSVWNAKGMASAYNIVIEQIKAKYKVYIHHDTFIINRDLLVDVMNEFKKDDKVGLIGIAGTKKLNDVAKWWESKHEDLRMCLYQDAVLNILRSVSVTQDGKIENAEALDGIFLATSSDVHWREDVFDGWHFYDISQCYEFRKAGLRTGVLNYNEPVIMHETTMKKDAANLYDKYREMFIVNYL